MHQKGDSYENATTFTVMLELIEQVEAWLTSRT